MLKKTRIAALLASCMLSALPLHSFASNNTNNANENANANGMQQTDDRAEQQRLRRESVRRNYTKHEFRIPMRDGTKLFTAVYVPNDASEGKSYPFLMQRTPYSVGPYGTSNYKGGLGTTPEYEKKALSLFSKMYAAPICPKANM